RINCVNSLAHWQIITESESIKEPRGRSRSQSYSQIALLHSHLFLHDQLTFADISGTDNTAAAWRCITSISINSLRRSAKIIASRILLMRVSSIRSRAKSCAQVAPVPRTVLRSWVLVTLAQTLHRQTTPFP